jgi:hypothetical protein
MNANGSVMVKTEKNGNIRFSSKIIGYDFDGVLHRTMRKYDMNGQGHPNLKIDSSLYIPNKNIIDEIKQEIRAGTEVHIISRNPKDKKNFLITNGLEYLADNYDKYVHISKGNKSEDIKKYSITEFTEDSINELHNIYSIVPDVILYLMTTIKIYRTPTMEPVKESYNPKKV